MGNTRGLLIAGIPGHNGAELMTGVVIVHGVGATGNTVVLVPCSRSGTLAPCTTWAYVGGGGADVPGQWRLMTPARHPVSHTAPMCFVLHQLNVGGQPSEAIHKKTDWAAGLFLGLQFLIGVIVPSLPVASVWNIIHLIAVTHHTCGVA